MYLTWKSSFYLSQSQNLRQGIVMKTSLETRVSQIGLDSFVDINIFVKNIILFSFFKFSIFLRISQIKIYTNVKTPKRKLESFVQRYSLKFRAQSTHVSNQEYIYCSGVNKGGYWGYLPPPRILGVNTPP